MEQSPQYNSTRHSPDSNTTASEKKIENQVDFKFADKPPINNNLLAGWKKVDVVTNFLRVNFNQQNKKVWEYAIILNGNFNEDDQKKKAIKQLIPKLREKFSPFKLSGYSFFSMANIQESLNFPINIGEEEINCTIKNTNHFIDLSNVNQKNTKFNNDVKSFFEKVIKQIIMSNRKMLRIKDSYYDLSNMKPMEEKSFLMSGFSTGFRNCESGFLLLVNIKNKFINGVNCLDKLSELRRKYPEGNDFQNEAKNYFNNLTIMTTYGNPRTYKLAGVNFEKNIMNTTIKMRNTGEDISLLTYYNTNYPDQRIKSNNQPLLVVEKIMPDESVEHIYLVPELCNLTGMDDNSTELKSKMTNRTRTRPNDKMRQIEGFLNLINNREKKKKKSNGVVVKEMESPMEIRDDWGIKFDGFKQTAAKVIPSPIVCFANSKLISLN
jgi:aubergine-like protein